MTTQSYVYNIENPQNGIIIIELNTDILFVEVVDSNGRKRSIKAGETNLAVVTKIDDTSLVVYYESNSQALPGSIKRKNVSTGAVGSITYEQFKISKQRMRVLADISGATPSIVYAKITFKTFLRGGSIIEGGTGYTTLYGREISKTDSIVDLEEFTDMKFKTVSFFESGEVIFTDQVAYAECSIEIIIMSKDNSSTPIFRDITILGEDI